MSAALPRQCEQHQPLRDPSGRQRRLMRGFTVVNNDVENLAPDDIWQFTDYHGQQPYLDYDAEFDWEAEPPVEPYDAMRYLDGSTVHAQQAASNGAARYYHGDLTGSTNALTDTGGSMLTGGTTTNGGPFYYTSFGERVYYDSGSSSWKLGGEFPIGSPRYLYDGGHGYETGHLALSGANSTLAPITFQHVGERWYQPEIGRFVQRDPIGLGGVGLMCIHIATVIRQQHLIRLEKDYGEPSEAFWAAQRWERRSAHYSQGLARSWVAS